MGDAKSETKLRKLEAEVETTVSTIWQCMTQVNELSNSEGQLERSQESLHETLNRLMLNLENVDRASRTINDTIPLEVIHRVDRGQNPDFVMKKQIEEAMAKNVEARTRVFGAHALEKTLSAYLDLWEKDDAKMKKSAQLNS
mmetsp:Transcript_6882/g.9534  ORF Transcript_6882/g.9534 Transcript_6882/m.9534 type:complete len:142 (+) Transcript_6882:35-460(+)|eukprot:CAMPEP_0184484652 /NCGR_PEP_ID=MMETSP0113_2-20130426/6346_1 /TAXON_ID=91329 /ORGANISM="Norrisiella sphaerica, Strain BC52" /LENGTH=141 /DNA_ID=CAMNT_0026865739 /DNA_START=18 /DNA_END=443 /DNA_ORIENTATION=-